MISANPAKQGTRRITFVVEGKKYDPDCVVQCNPKRWERNAKGEGVFMHMIKFRGCVETNTFIKPLSLRRCEAFEGYGSSP